MIESRMLLAALFAIPLSGVVVGDSAAQTAVPAGANSRATAGIGAKAPSPDLKEAVVFANPARFRVHLRFGKITKKIESRKATVIRPKKYPLRLEYYSGNRTKGYLVAEITKPGVYVFRWDRGQWSYQLRSTQASATRRSPTSRTTSSYQRTTGSYPRTARRTAYTRRTPTRYRPRYPVYRYGNRWTTWASGVWGLMKLHRYVRDEEDRDLIRDIIIGREIDDAIDREAIDREIDRIIGDGAVNLPANERRELDRAIEEIGKVDRDDWKQIATLPADDWDQLKDAVGSDISGEEWKALDGWVDTFDQPGLDEDAALDDLNIDDLDSDIELGDLGGAAGLDDLDLGSDFGLDMDDIDLSDIAGDAGNLDLSDWGAGGYDPGGFDPGGGFDGAGAFDDPGLDLGDYGGGFGGGFDGGDWGGGDFGGDFGGGDFGGDFGGGDFFD